MVVAVLLTLHDELSVIPRQELDGVQRFHVFIRCLAEEFSDLLAGLGMIGYETTVVLLAV